MLQTITQGEWGGEYAKLNQMFAELATHAGTSYIPIWEDWWANIYLDLNSNFTTLYDALGGTGRETFLVEETWGSVRGKMNTMFPYLYDLLDSEVEFEVTGSPPIEGVNITITRSLAVSSEETSYMRLTDAGWHLWTVDCPHAETYEWEPSVHYDRMAWRQVHPLEPAGVSTGIDWDYFDSRLAAAKALGMTWAFRISTCRPGWAGGQVAIPQWLADKGVVLDLATYGSDTFYIADFDDTTMMQYHNQFIEDLAERYDGHPDLAFIDIGSVGYWGEWVFAGNTSLRPSMEARKAVIDAYCNNFTETPLCISHNVRLPAADALDEYVFDNFNVGWRGDSWGDGPPSLWNHHVDEYWYIHNKFPNQWQKGPVIMEPSNTLGSESTPPDEVVDDAISWHACLIKNKNTLLPEAWMSDIGRMMLVIGYRIMLKSAVVDNMVVGSGGSVGITLVFENKGLSPSYRDHRIAVRLRKGSNLYGETITTNSIKGWLPSVDQDVSILYSLPSVSAGTYSLDIGIVYNSSLEHVTPIANTDLLSDKWYHLTNIKIT